MWPLFTYQGFAASYEFSSSFTLPDLELLLPFQSRKYTTRKLLVCHHDGSTLLFPTIKLRHPNSLTHRGPKPEVQAVSSHHIHNPSQTCQEEIIQPNAFLATLMQDMLRMSMITMDS